MDNQHILNKFGYRIHYPDDAIVYAFDCDSNHKGLEVHVHREELVYKVSIKPVTGGQNPEHMAGEIFNNQLQEPLTDDIPPYAFQTLYGEGWRFRKVFSEGFQVPFFQEVAFLNQPGGMLQVEIIASPSHFFDALLEFDDLLQSITFKED